MLTDRDKDEALKIQCAIESLQERVQMLMDKAHDSDDDNIALQKVDDALETAYMALARFG